MRIKPQPPTTGIDSDDRLWIDGKIANRGDMLIFTLDNKNELVEIEDIYIEKFSVNSKPILIIRIYLSNRYILESIEEIKEVLSW